MKGKLRIENVKGQSKEVELGRINLITGDNGSGKSTILESLVVALDGEHPIAGKTLAAVCSMMSDDNSEIELSLEREGEHINVRRVYTCGDRNTQKIFINDKEERQDFAKSAIDDFLGGSSSRKISPYKFGAMSPKDRLAVLGEMIPADKAPDMDKIIKRILYSGSEEVMGIARFQMRKTIDELSDEEFDKVVETAKSVDDEYIKLVEPYLKEKDYNDPFERMEALLALNREFIRENQSEINRITKSLQTHQDLIADMQEGLGSEPLDDIREARILLDRKINEISGVLATHKQGLQMKEDMEKRLIELKKDNMGLEDNIKALNDKLSKLKKEGLPEEDLNVRDMMSKIEGNKSIIKRSAEAKENIIGIEKDIESNSEKLEDANKKYEDMRVKAKELTHESVSLSVEMENIMENIALLEGEESCPTCGSQVDIEHVVEVLRGSWGALNKRKGYLDKEYSTLEKELNKISSAVDELNDKKNKLKHDNLQSKGMIITKQKEGELTKEIAKLESQVDGAKRLAEYKQAESELKTLEAKKDNISEVAKQLKGLKLDCEHTDEELEKLRENRVEIDAIIEKAIEAESMRKIISNEQIDLEGLKVIRTELKKITDLLMEARRQAYWFVDDVSKVVSQVMGKEGSISNEMFGVSHEGVEISDKVLSGGEKLLFITSVLLAFAQLSEPKTAKIIEIEGSELDEGNLRNLVNIIKQYPEVDMAIITSHLDVEVEGVNNIKIN